ncbi:LuxR C-terminal-related transcriptional regulator [Nonomuraea sp. LP-02]|uniref:ATP-binding protein n=1 Tax=Nonomuraea sp. LP-02 TaxID=3097960 RepID=UPI002E322FE1|nr:LuxR C-terminal-related transcriptional regulator [Nonomuraea sp. LP-02]MED7923937.1 LuxR C-terminal-related transcriptional regulator [Nonomuraea sp. LP-02]
MSPTGSLPAELNSFVGRRREIAEVKRLLGEGRLVTLAGVGGVGKSRLALRVAFDLRRAYHDGVWLVELAALESAELLVATVMAALGIQDSASRPSLEVLAAHLRDRRTLVVLDNCEHLLDPCAALADRLVRAAPGLRILATSRQALGVTGEQVLQVPTLAVPEAAEAGARADAQTDAVRLFAERARAVLPGFEITDANREAVARVCRRLDGIPLAIELAAVRLRALSVEQLLERLDDRFRLLTTGARTAMPRQQTLRSLIDWSHALCTEQERLLWSRLSVFSGGLDLEAAEQVCSGGGIPPEDVMDLVGGLVDKSVLAREEHRQSVRYRLLETIRQYGRERLRESGEEAELRARHRAYFRDLALRARRGWYGPDQVAWFARLRADHGNLRTALDSALPSGSPGSSPYTPGPEGTRDGLVLATALCFQWIAAGALREGRAWLARLLAAAPEPTPERAEALCVQARLAVLQSDFEEADTLLRECRELGATLPDPPPAASVTYVAGLAALMRHDPKEAVTLLGEAADGHRADGEESGVVNALMYLATAHGLLGDDERAIDRFKECLARCEARHEHWFRSYTLWLFGIETWRQGDPDRAIEMEREAIRLKQPFDDRLGIALCVEALAWMTADASAERAATLLGASQESWRAFGGPLFGYLEGYHDAAEAAARERLGARGFAAAFRKGVELPPADVPGYATGSEKQRPRAQQTGETSPLTRREREIAALVARGMSNKEIAATLVIAQRTAEAHVEHILCKLGFTSRAQIAALVAGQGDHAEG